MVRREMRLALKPDPSDGNVKSKPIVLVLVEGFVPPDPTLLPEDIRKISTKQGIEFYRRFFDAGVEYLARFCERLVPEAFEHQSALYTPNRGNLEIRLKQSVREAIEQLTKQLVRDTKQPSDEISKSLGYNAWTTAEGLLALLYTDTSPISFQTAVSLDQHLLARVAWKLVNIDTSINGGGIPADPDLRISDKGVVDTTAIVISTLCSLRLYMYQHGLDTLTAENASINLLTIDECIERLCNWLRKNQNDDFGWGLWRNTKSRVTATTWAILAFVDAGVNIEEQFLQKAQNWLIETQKDDGWWSLTPESSEVDVTSTSFAIIALSVLSNTIMQENIQRAVYALETNTHWDDAEHKVELPTEHRHPGEFVNVIYASEPRAICAMLVGGMSPTSPFILNMLGKILDEELPSGGWTMKKSKNRTLNMWYTYVVIECIYYWFIHCNEISYLVRLSRVDKALRGMVKMYQAKREEVQRLSGQIKEIKNIIEQ